MSYIVKVIQLTDPMGERLPIVCDSQTGIPHIEINQYIIRRRRGIVSFNTIKKEAYVLCLFIDWLTQNNIQLNEIDIDLIGQKDIHGLWEKLRQSIDDRTDKRIVSSEVHMYRWSVVKSFLRELFSRKLLKYSYKDEKFKNLIDKKDIIFSQFDSLNYSYRKSRKSGLDEKIIRAVLKYSRLDYEGNPWIKRDRLRNELIIDFLICFGLRAGELLKISLHDINLHGISPTLTIKVVEDDPQDPRRNEPRVKTKGRILDIDPIIVKKISHYLKERRLIKNAKRHKYLFISNTNGDPLSYDGIKRMLRRFENDFHDLSGVGLSCHAFRRSWNDRFRRAGEDLGIDEEMITQSQNYLQGRNLDSQEAYIYASKHIQKVARESHIAVQKGYLNGID